MTSNAERATKDAIETAIDTYGLWAVLQMTADVCAEKRDHIRENWQDRATARPWNRAATLLYHVRDKIEQIDRMYRFQPFTKG
jgi:23S rRNA G2069 N7-methylase RlmK/C1962 C5-methylase RlmI